MRQSNFRFALIGVACATLMTACQPKQAEFNIDDYIIGNDYYIDTICRVDGRAYCMMVDPNFGINVLYDQNGIIVFNPLLAIDSIDGTIYNVSSFLRDTNVDFADSASIEALKAQYPQYKDFHLVCKGFENAGLQPAVYGMSVDEPDDNVKFHKELNRWIQVNLGDTVASLDDKITADSVVRRNADLFFKNFDDIAPGEETQYVYSGNQSFLIYERTPTYITYIDYTYEYTGGAHGIYGISLASFSMLDGTPIDQEYLFKPECDEAVKMLVYEAIAADRYFAENHGMMNPQEVKSYLNDYLDENLPCPALTSRGVVYCFQPYELGCYAEGEYDFFIPYAKVQPYLTLRAQSLLRN